MTGPRDSNVDNRFSPEALGVAFISERGGVINPKVELLTDPERGPVWQQWTAEHLPVDVYRAFGMVDVEGSGDYLNVVEHNIFVAAASLTVGRELAERGVAVDLGMLTRAAIVHDASKRLDVERKLSRESEAGAGDRTLEVILAGFDYTEGEITAAKNTGRLPDRYIQDPVERIRAIAGHTVEENIIGYVDARTRGSRIVSIEEAERQSVQAKPKSAEFFTDNWRPYYDAVEGYMRAIAPGFNPAEITDDAIYDTIVQSVADGQESIG